MELFNDKSFHDSLTVRHQLELLRTSGKSSSEDDEEEIIEEEEIEPEPLSAHSKKQSLTIEPDELEFIAISPTDSVKSAEFSSVAQDFEEARFTYKINVMIKKYAEFLFKEFGLDHKTMNLNRQQFGQLVSKHPKLYDSYI